MYRLRHIIPALGACALLAAACAHNAPQQPAEINLATYNIRYHNGGDSARGDGWGQRYPHIANIVKFHDFDIFGTQEGYTVQLEELKEALPGFAYIGVGRDDGRDAGEHSAIFYRTDLFEVVDSGNFWLSETPDTPSVGWDAALPRICSWGHFRHTPSGKEFMMFNLHMDHVGKQARVESAKLVRAMIDSLGRGIPAVVTGDFNVDQNHESYGTMTADQTLLDSYEAADLVYADNGTFNNFMTDGYSTSRIDHIFVTPNIDVKRYGVLTDTYRTADTTAVKRDLRDAPTEIEIKHYKARVPSDHFPVEVTLEF